MRVSGKGPSQRSGTPPPRKQVLFVRFALRTRPRAPASLAHLLHNLLDDGLECVVGWEEEAGVSETGAGEGIFLCRFAGGRARDGGHSAP